MAGRFVLPGDGDITLSGDAVRRILGSASGDAALVYIYILSRGGRMDIEDAAQVIHRTPEQVESAMEILEKLTLVSTWERGRSSPKLERPDELPEYTAEEIAREMKSGSDFPKLVEEVQKALGSTLSSEGLKTLFGIYDFLGLPPEVILELVTWCVMECQRRYGPGRRPSMRYIEREAFKWDKEEIFSEEAAMAYLKRLDGLRGGEREISDVLGISGRTLSQSERRYINSWTEMGFHGEAVGIAYDRTVLKTGKLTWRYMDSILKSWHSKGLHTPKEIMEGDAPPSFRRDRPSPRGNTRAPAPEQGMDELREILRKVRGDKNES